MQSSPLLRKLFIKKQLTIIEKHNENLYFSNNSMDTAKLRKNDFMNKNIIS